MLIVGAGMSGMLAAHYFRHLNPTIIEKQETLPNNHKALLRFRSEAVSDLTGIPFKKVSVSKCIKYGDVIIHVPDIFLCNNYSFKTTGAIRSRSISNLDDCTRYIAPSDFINKLSTGLAINYDTEFTTNLLEYKEPIISTMPVYLLAKALGYEGLPHLKTKPISTLAFELDMDIDVYQTVYFPGDEPYYRASITGNRFIVETAEEDIDDLDMPLVYESMLHILDSAFGIDYKGDAKLELNHQPYGKLIECDTNEVKKFIGWASNTHNIYSLGRWGTHRQILMDDVVNDIKVIDKMIRSNNYER